MRWPGGLLCSDLHECDLEMDDCPQWADCFNLEGTFSCACPDGFRWATEAEINGAKEVRCCMVVEINVGVVRKAGNTSCNGIMASYEKLGMLYILFDKYLNPTDKNHQSNCTLLLQRPL